MHCKICQASMQPFVDEEQSRLYHYCKPCDWIVLDQVCYPGAAEEKSEYLKHDNRIENAGYVQMFERLLAFMAEHRDLPHPGQALEFGCGHGPVLARMLRDLGLQVDLYDKFFYPEKIYMGRKYDLITATEVIEHIANPLEILQLWHSLLKPHGCIVLSTLLHPGPQDFLSWWYRRESSHISFFRKDTFIRLCAQTGLRLLACNNRDHVMLAQNG